MFNAISIKDYKMLSDRISLYFVEKALKENGSSSHI